MLQKSKSRSVVLIMLTFFGAMGGAGMVEQLFSGIGQRQVWAHELSQATREEVLSWLQKGRQQYDHQKFRQALKTLEPIRLHLNHLKKREKAVFFDSLGQVYLHLADYRVSYEDLKKARLPLESALTLYRDLDDQPKIVQTLLLLSRNAYNEKYLEEAKTIAKTLGDRTVEAEVLHQKSERDARQAFADSILGSPKLVSLDKLNQALDLRRSVGDRSGEGRTLLSLGDLYGNSRDYPRALSHLDEALTLFETLGDHHHTILTLHAIGTVHEQQDDVSKAIERYQSALEFAQTHDQIDAEAKTWLELGQLYKQDQSLDKANKAVARSLELSRDLGRRNFEIKGLKTQAEIALAKGEKASSIEWYRQGILLEWEKNERICQSNQIVALADAQSKYFQEARLQIKDYQKVLEMERQLNQRLVDDYEKALIMERQLNNLDCELRLLAALKDPYDDLKAHSKVLDLAQRTLDIVQSSEGQGLKDSSALNQLVGDFSSPNYYIEQDAPVSALKILKIAQKIAVQTGNEWKIATILENSGDLHKTLKNTAKAVEYYRQSILFDWQQQDRVCRSNQIAVEGEILLKLGGSDDSSDAEASEKKQTNLMDALTQEQDPDCQLTLINELNPRYWKTQNFEGLRKNIDQSLMAIRQLKPDEIRQSQQVNALAEFLRENVSSTKLVSNGLFSLEQLLSENSQIENHNIIFYQQAVEIALLIDDAALALDLTGGLAAMHWTSGNVEQAIEISQTGLEETRRQGFLKEQAAFLSTLSSIYSSLGNYAESERLRQQGTQVRQKIQEQVIASGDSSGILKEVLRFGDIVPQLASANNAFAKGNFLASANISRETIGLIEDLRGSLGGLPDIPQLTSLKTILDPLFDMLGSGSNAYLSRAQARLNQRDEALATLDKTILSVEKAKEKFGFSLAQLSELETGQSEDEIQKTLSQLLDMSSHLFDPLVQLLLGERGNLYSFYGQPHDALKDYRRAFNIDVPSALSSRSALQLGLARVYRDLDLPHASIAHYKKATQSLENFRGALQNLSPELQSSFLDSSLDVRQTQVADVYRELADLLMAQGRIAEAQQVLELLKIREINDFTQETRAGTEPSDIPLNESEKLILEKHESLVLFGQKLETCEQTQCAERQSLRDDYNQLVQSFDQSLQALKAQLSDRRLVQVDSGTTDFVSGSNKILRVQPKTMLIYPLVLKDNVRLLWASEGGVLGSATCPLGESELWPLITEFRTLLSTPNSSIDAVKETGNKLYSCLIQPLQAEIEAGGIQNLVFVPDRATNYIPMGALFDGDKFLVETYNTSAVLSAGLTDVSDRLPTEAAQTQTLALGLSKAVEGFNALANVPNEIDSIVKEDGSDRQGIFPGMEFLDQAFSKATLEDNLRGQKILHIATHGQFVPDDPKASYLLMGTGEKLPIRDIQYLRNLEDIHLVVLSACETALGGPDQNGIEIPGISSYFTQNKAKSVLASLWQVNDFSTNQLMQAFYSNLSQRKGQNISKADALRQAQVQLLQGQLNQISGKERGRVVVKDGGHPKEASYSHPYYWAPFILIGNSR